MSRKDDLERSIRDSYEIIREYEDQIRIASRPEEKARARRAIDEQWTNIEGYLAEYLPLAGGPLSEEIAQIAAHFSGPGGLSVPAGSPSQVPCQPFEPEMVWIPAGPFLMGSDTGVDSDARDIEQPQHILYLPDYYIARTPVTNAQYLACVQATDCQPPEHWKSKTPPKGEEDHPVTWISWHEAVDYCEWLAEVTRRPYRLPSEAEWEKAARGTDGRLYPWGNEWDAERCNTLETGGEGTTPVGAYGGRGDSPYGCTDMAGNVWEWTGSLYGTYPYDPGDGREEMDAKGRRVVRGGSFLNSRVLARCAYRPGYFPGRRMSYGCRVACSPSPGPVA